MKKNILVLLTFLLLALVYFLNAFVGKLLPFYMDIYGYFYPMMGLVKEQYLSGIFPFWNSYMFSGFPLMATSQHGVLYPVTIALSLLLPQHLAFISDLAMHVALGGFFTFLYAKKLGAEDFAAFTAGTLFAFMGYLIYHIEFVSMLHTAVWIPLILYFFEDIRIRPCAINALKASFILALQIFAGHPQIYFFTYMLLSFFTAYHIFHLESDKRLPFLGFCFAAVALGFIIASPQLYATYELSSLSVRTEPIYENFSMHPFELDRLPGFLFPSLYQGKTEGYIGRLPVLLAVVAVIIGRKDDIHIRFWSYIAIGSLALALGDAIRPLNKLMFHVPVYGSFRGFSKHLIEFILSLSFLSAFGITQIIDSEKAKKALIWVMVLMLTLAIASFLFAASTGDSKLPGPGTVVPFVFLFLCLLASVFILKSRRYKLFKYVVIISIFIEVLSYRPAKWTKIESIEHYQAQLFSYFSGKSDRVSFMGEEIIPLLAMSHNISLIEGYDPLILNDYNQLLQLGGIGGWAKNFWPDLIKNNTVLSMLNNRFIFLPGGISITDVTSTYKKLFDTPSGTVYENAACLPRSYKVSELLGIDGFEGIQEALLTSKINPKSQAIVSKNDLRKIGSQYFHNGEVSIIDYGHTKCILKTDFTGEGFVVLSDQYYPGWKAYIDGRQAPIWKTNGILRGVVVPAGRHELIFAYRPWKIYVLLMLSGLVSITGLTVILKNRT